MADSWRKDGFLGEMQINVPAAVLNNQVRQMPFLHALYITHIGYFPNAQYHYRERENGCDDYILFYCLGGKGYIETKTSKHTLAANQFMILPPHAYHKYQADLDTPWTIYWVHFSGAKLNKIESQFQLRRFQRPVDIHYQPEILHTWQEMYQSLQQGYTAEHISFSNMMLYSFLTYFIFPHRQQLIQKTKATHHHDPFEQSIQFMKEHIGDRYTVEALASRFHMSTSHFTAQFKKRTGMSPMDYFIRMKVQYACQLLSQSHLLIKEVAAKIGYDDPFHFSKIFKKVTGKSPAQYKEGK
jgi:AraC-like DNA-binding protein